MRVRVSHEIKLTFSAPARSLHLNLRLTPRSFESQYVLRWRVGVDLDASLKPREDAFGSLMHALSWHKPVEAVTITAAGEVQTSDAVGVVRGAVDPLPADMYLRASPLAQANAALRADSVAPGETLARLHQLMVLLRAKIACARGWGVPARFVTGYRVAETPGEPTEMFAWAEALLPGLGWVAFDAVHDLCPNDRYVRVAVGLDANDAAPVRSWVNAGETATTVSLRVEQAGAQGQN